jgi:hypothetical protein
LAKTKTIENLFNSLAHYSDLLPIFFFLFFLRKNSQPKGIWIIIVYTAYDFLINFGLLYLSHKPLKVFLYSSYTFFEYLFFAYFFLQVIKNPRFKKIISIVSIIFSVFLILYAYLGKVKGIDSLPIGIETILILVFSFYFLFEQLNDTTNLFIYSKYTFWIILGMLLYLAGSFFIYIYASQLNQEEILKYWIFTNIFSIIKNILFVIALAVHANQSQTKNTGYLYTLN